MTSLSETSLLAGSSGVTSGYTIDQSIRFNDNDSPYLYKAYSGAGSKQTFTCSFWMKVGNVTSARRGLISFVQDVPLELYSADNLRVFLFGAERLVTNKKLRDVSAWYHIVLRVDSTETVSNNRIRLYINGERETDFSAESYPSQNATGNMWGSNLLQFGRTYGSSYYFDGYLAEIHYADGYSYGPENFGEFKNNTDIWIPKEFEGSYGTNGVYLKGEDSSAFGNDSSGNDNDFGNVFGLTASDQVLDSPTNNFCTGLPTGVGNATGVTFSEGNLTGKTSGTAGNWVSSIPVDSGKWYFEVNNHAQGSGNNYGIGQTPDGSYHHFALGSGGNQINDYDIIVNTGSSGSIVGYKLDFDAGTLTHTTDGTSYSSTGSLAAGMAYAAFARLGSSSGHVAFNFGQDSTFGGLETAGGNSDSNGIGNFYYNVPSGFLAICSKNLGS